MSKHILQAHNVAKQYTLGAGIKLDVLKGVSLHLSPGEMVAIRGSSGSGKSTLLHILGALDSPTSGHVTYEGQNTTALTQRGRDALRCSTFGFVFQFYHLLPDLSVLENALFPQMIANSTLKWWGRKADARARCVHLLEKVGLGGRLDHRPNQLSGGERQRVAIARALANDPAVLLADEPTGNLDKKTGHEVLRVLHDLHGSGQTIVMVTHDQEVAQTADRVLFLEDGLLGTA